MRISGNLGMIALIFYLSFIGSWWFLIALAIYVLIDPWSLSWSARHGWRLVPSGQRDD